MAKTKKIAVIMPAEYFDTLQGYAKEKYGRNVSDEIRQAIEDYINKKEGLYDKNKEKQA